MNDDCERSFDLSEFLSLENSIVFSLSFVLKIIKDCTFSKKKNQFQTHFLNHQNEEFF
jgi:hypothetical protein